MRVESAGTPAPTGRATAPGPEASSKAERAMAGLQEDIMLGSLGPRARLTEDEVMERFALKRHAAREVLARLGRMGIVVKQPNRGATVRSFSADEVEQVYHMRSLLQREAARLIPLPAPAALLRRLRASGKPVYALSNFAHETFALAERKHDFLREFDDRVISGHVGFAKPDASIYEILFKRAGRRPSELLFIDDSRANVRASEALGMPAILFRPGVDLESELHARGALP